MMKEQAAYDNLPAKQSRWEISLHNAGDLPGEVQRPSDNLPALGDTPIVKNGIMSLPAPVGVLINLHDCQGSTGHTGGYGVLG